MEMFSPARLQYHIIWWSHIKLHCDLMVTSAVFTVRILEFHSLKLLGWMHLSRPGVQHK